MTCPVGLLGGGRGNKLLGFNLQFFDRPEIVDLGNLGGPE